MKLVYATQLKPGSRFRPETDTLSLGPLFQVESVEAVKEKVVILTTCGATMHLPKTDLVRIAN